ncbi:MAG: AAA family ATPase [Candidatus Micrarchaeaceae archaeon]
MAHFIIITGSPGAGKTTIATTPITLKGCKVVNVGDIMLEEAKRLKYVDNRDQIRYMSFKQLNEVRNRAFSKLSSMRGKVIIDTHDFVEARGKFTPGLPEELLLRLHSIEAFIYIDAGEIEILARRKKDISRQREADDEEIIRSQRILNLSALAYYSSKLNVPLYIIENRNGQLQSSISKYLSIVEEIFGNK